MKLNELNANKDFESILLEAIDEAFCTLGESVKTAIYFKLDCAFNIKKQDVPQKIECFSDALQQIFGLGASHLELMFMKCLHSKIMAVSQLQVLEFELPEMTFKEYVSLARQILTVGQKKQLTIAAH